MKSSLIKTLRFAVFQTFCYYPKKPSHGKWRGRPAPEFRQIVEFISLPFPFSSQLRIYSIHVVHLQERQGNFQKIMIHVQSCCVVFVFWFDHPFFVNLMVTPIVFLGWSYDLNAADGMFSFFLVLEFWNLDKCNLEEPWSNATTLNNFTRVHPRKRPAVATTTHSWNPEVVARLVLTAYWCLVKRLFSFSGKNNVVMKFSYAKPKNFNCNMSTPSHRASLFHCDKWNIRFRLLVTCWL